MCRRLNIIGRIVSSCAIIVLECACAVGRLHTSDYKLEQKFLQNQTAFEELLRDVRADNELASIGPYNVWYHGVIIQGQGDFADLQKSGFTIARWKMYLQRMDRLGIKMIAHGDGAVVFKADRESITNGDSSKGYVYSLNAPSAHRKDSLDGYRLSDEDKDKHGDVYVYRPLRGHWYLFLYVNS